MKIIFRCCEKQESISTVPRWNNINKTNILKTCWLSLLPSVTSEDELIILEDNVSEDTINFMAKHVPDDIELDIFSVPEHEWTYNLHTVMLFDILEEKLSETSDHEVFYLVEDDYLHIPEGIAFIRDAANWFSSCFLAPYDYPDRYKMEQLEPTIVYPGPGCHWRLNNSSTMTLAAKNMIWKKYLPQLKKAAPTSNDKVFEEIFKETPCLSPLPGVASHLTPFHMSLYVDWESIWNEINSNNG